MRPPEVFVRSLSHQDAVRLKRLSTEAEHQSTRIRAAILLASNMQTSVPQIARMWLTDESHVRKVIHEFNEEGFDSLRPEYRGGRPRRITPAQRKRAVAVAGALPDTQGVPLSRWSLDRLSAWLAEQGVEISPAHLARLLRAAGLSFRHNRSWKASPDPDYEAKAARVLDLYANAPADGPVVLRSDGTDQSASHSGLHTASPSGCAQLTTAGTGSVTCSAPWMCTMTGCGRACVPTGAGSTTSDSCARSGSAIPPASGSTGSKTTSRLTGPPTSAPTLRPTRSSSSRPPTYASYLNRIESRFRPIQEFVFNNTDYLDWASAQRALADHITYRNGRDHDRRSAALERRHRIAA